MWMWNDGWGHMADWGWGWGIAGMLMMVVFWGAVLLFLFYAFRSVTARDERSTTNRHSDEDRALTVLRERYARGDIDREEFEARRRVLNDPAGSQ